MSGIGNALRKTLFWNPEPLFGVLGGTGTWSSSDLNETWSEDADHRDDNVAFNGLDNVVFPFTDAFGSPTRTENIVRVSGGVTSGNIEGSKKTLIEQSPFGLGGSLSVGGNAVVSHSDLTLDSVLGGNLPFTVTGGITLIGTNTYTGTMTLDRGGVSILGLMTGGPNFFIGDGGVTVGANGRLTSSDVTIDRTGLSDFRSGGFNIISDDGEGEARFQGRITLIGDNADVRIDGDAFVSGRSGTLVSGSAGEQSVRMQGAEASVNGALRMGADADAVQIYESRHTGFVNMGDGRDFVAVDGSEDDVGTLDGNVQFGEGQDDLVIYENGQLLGNVQMGSEDDEVEIYGLLNGTLRLSTGNDEVTILDGRQNGKLLGQSGDDTIEVEGTGSVQGSVVLGAGNDTLLVSDAGTVTGRILCGGGDDVVEAGDGDNRIFGKSGEDSLAGGDGNDLISGNGDDDTLDGGAGNDILRGGGGDDVLLGEAGADRLLGQEGDDTLDGGAGGDALTGGSGADLFVFSEITINGPGEADDTIFDFSSAEGDRIHLAAIDADTTNAGNDAFTFATSFSGTAGELIADGTPGGLFLRGDVDGDGIGELEIFVFGVSSLDAGDLIL